MRRPFAVLFLLVAGSTPLVAQPTVGPAKGAVMVVGGGSIGKETFAKFIELAGGPDALIIDVPTAGGAATYGAATATSRQIVAAGAHNVLVLHTVNRAVADADSFVAPIRKAGGIWFEGGRQWHLVDSYAGTKSETEFNDVLARGGVIGGTSAGASILASFLLRGAREGNEVVVAPQYLKGFGYLRNVAIDQHVVARSRLRDLADSLLPRYPKLLGISEDEATVWLVQGDQAEILGRNKAFVYGGKQTDAGKPFLTLHPGDRYDLGKRVLLHRAADGTGISEKMVDDLVKQHGGAGPVTVVVARAGQVLVNKGYNVPEQMVKRADGTMQPTYMPVTTVPQFELGDISRAYQAIAAQMLVHDGKLSLEDTAAGGTTVKTLLTVGGTGLGQLLTARGGARMPTRIYTPIGEHQTTIDPSWQVRSDVDEMYRLEFGLEDPAMFIRDTSGASAGPGIDPTLGWTTDQFQGQRRAWLSVAPGGTRGVFMRFPDQRLTVIVLGDQNDLDARTIAEQIAGKLLK